MSKIKHLAELTLLKVVAGLFGILPLEWASWLMGRLWRTLAPLTRRHKRAQQLLQRALPELSSSERQTIIIGMWENLGRTFIETLQISRLIREPRRVTYSSKQLAERINDSQRGALLIGMHSGNWELAPLALAFDKEKIGIIYQKIKNPYIDTLVCDIRHQLIGGGCHPKGGRTAIWLVSWLKAGNYVAMLGDLRERTGVAVPFFGRPAYSSITPATIALRLNLPVIAFRVVRLDGLRFRIDSCEISPNSSKTALNQQAVELTCAINNQFEKWIREYPEQWMWIHNRWS